MVEEVIRQFRALALIPRATFHEQRAAEYIEKLGIKYGCKTVRDSKNNVVIDKPAHAGYEHVPRVILQAHIDMVCKGTPGRGYDPLKDGIQLVEEEGRITAEGTTLGADNGIGAALILEILRGEEACGPVRGIFTVEEEEGMGGARSLDPSFVQDKYFIGLDWTSTRTSCIGCASSLSLLARKEAVYKRPEYDSAYRICLKGLPGGHSGLDIHRVKTNAVREMIKILQNILFLGIDFELAHIAGGTAKNVIPDSCTGTICIKSDCINKFLGTLSSVKKQMFAFMEAEGEDVVLTVEKAEKPDRVLERQCAKEILDFVQSIPNGVVKTEPGSSGYIHLSSNIGTISTGTCVELSIMARGSRKEYLDLLYTGIKQQAGRCRLDVKCISKEPGFDSKRDGKLIRRVCEIYRAQNNEELTLEKIHAGLECGYFKQKNPDMEVIVLGADLENIHTTKETLYTERLGVLCRLLLEVLRTAGSQ
ncbi:M20/M25/M40 family metallo-hydrolase [[Clostridium] hylemonae]|uniref:M20/M25/M40 family metallo-hydrolase n=1 Tax=[Clostridium] hylemonae TaxID=89153 RepID=UPI001FCC8419|nr:M20/M25/M40 family metallo-hydrolase [[Clostridium] hylemonae]BDF06086.1 aminoacyl-histidine dipeptidase [[Clostridium] hylemonae]